MTRIILALLLVLSAVPLSAQGKLRPRVGSAQPQAVAQGPVVTVLTPSATGTYTTAGSSISPTGTCIGQAAPCTAVSWVNDRGGSGSATGAGTWSIAGGGSATAAQDSFTGDGNNVDVVTHTPNVGPAWSECIDTEGASNYFRLFNGQGNINPVNTVSSHTLAVCMSPTLSGNDYDVGFKMTSFQGGVDEGIIIFGRNSGTGASCGLVIRYGELQLYSLIGGSPSAIGAAVAVSSANGDTYLVQKRGDDHTILQNGVSRMTRNTANCSAGTQVGIGAGAYDGSGRINNIQIDDWIVTDQAASGSIPLLTGVNVITFTGTDAAANTRNTVFTVTRTAGDTVDPQPVISIPEPDGASATALSTTTLSGTAQDDVSLATLTMSCPGATPSSPTVTPSPSLPSAALVTWTTGSITIPVGATTCTLTATDATGNDATAVHVITRSTDVTPPSISINYPSASTPYTALTPTGYIGGTASDDQALQAVTWSCDIATPATGSTGPSLQNWQTATLTWGEGANTCIITATDQATNTATATIVVNWAPPLTITTVSMQAATQNVAYSVTLNRSGGTAAFTWVEHVSGTSTIPGGGACTGLTISSAGVVSGTPTTTGTCSFTARVTDSLAATATQALSIVVSAPGSGTNARFDIWRAMSEVVKCASFRPVVGDTDVNSCFWEKQLKYLNTDGGWYNGSNATQAIYAPYDETMGAVKYVIPAFYPDPFGTVGTLIPSGFTAGCTNQIHIGTGAGQNNGVTIKADSEVMETCDPDGPGPTQGWDSASRLQWVERAKYGTSAAQHSVSAALYRATNSNVAYHIVPFTESTDGNTYLLTYDIRWTTSFLTASPKGGTGGTLENHKAQVLRVDPTYDTRWLEPNSVFDNSSVGTNTCYSDPGVMASFGVRNYNGLNLVASWAASDGFTRGPNATNSGDQLAPRTDSVGFCLYPDRWTRFWFRIQQVANDWDLVSVWAADEVQAPKLVISNIQTSVGLTGKGVTGFDTRFNASKDNLRHPNQENLEVHLKNMLWMSSPGLAAAGAFSDANMASTFLFQPVP